MRQGKSTTALLAVIKWDAVADLTEKDGNAREMFKTMLDSAKITELFNHNAHAAMPYVSPIAAALFSAYATVITFTQAQLVVLQTGLGKNALSSPDAVYKVLSAALPDWSEYINKVGAFGFAQVLDELEKRLLAELQRNIEGRGDDEAQVTIAAGILELVRDAERKMSERKVPAQFSQ